MPNLLTLIFPETAHIKEIMINMNQIVAIELDEKDRICIWTADGEGIQIGKTLWQHKTSMDRLKKTLQMCCINENYCETINFRESP